MTGLFILFVICNLINVALSTVKSIATIKGGKVLASIMNAVTYGFYTYIIVITANCDLETLTKCIVVGACNFVGVYLVKYLEERIRKDKLWKVELTVPTKYLTAVDFDLRDVPHSYIKISDKHTLFNFYCATKQETQKVKAITDQYNAKYFVAESKIL